MKNLIAATVAAITFTIGASSGANSATLGSSQATAAYSANQILLAGQSLGDGLYWIDPDGGATDNAFQIYSDMTTDGGGWTLGLNSLAGDVSASTDVTSNTGVVGLTSGHTRHLSHLAIDQNAQIRHRIVAQNGTVLFDAYYTGNYHGTMEAQVNWTLLAGNFSVLSYHFGRDWSTVSNDVDDWSGNCASNYGGNGWYHGACWTAIPTDGTGAGPFASGAQGSYSIFFRELNTPPAGVPIPAALPLLLSALGFFGLMGWRRKRMAAA